MSKSLGLSNIVEYRKSARHGILAISLKNPSTMTFRNRDIAGVGGGFYSKMVAFNSQLNSRQYPPYA